MNYQQTLAALLIKDKMKLLKKARSYIRKNEQDFICFALDKADIQCNANHVDNAYWELRSYIYNSLGDWASLDGWRRHRGMMTGHRKARLQWIDWMIASLVEDLAKLENL